MSDLDKVSKRCDLEKILPGARWVIVVAMNYYRAQDPLKKGYARVARYAYGRDYHRIMGKKLQRLRNFVRELGQKYMPEISVQAKSFVDVGPILERAMAEQAGIGVVGKNSCLITKDFGSWVLLGEIITNLDLAPHSSAPSMPTSVTSPERKPFPSCGACMRCVHACPTGAIIRPGVVDARLCISYLTIEHKGKIPAALARTIQKTRRIFGCDICQEVCPHNVSRQKEHSHSELMQPKIAGDQLFLRTVRGIKTDSMFHRKFAGSALKRAKKSGLRRNAAIIVKAKEF